MWIEVDVAYTEGRELEFPLVGGMPSKIKLLVRVADIFSLEEFSDSIQLLILNDGSFRYVEADYESLKSNIVHLSLALNKAF